MNKEQLEKLGKMSGYEFYSHYARLKVMDKITKEEFEAAFSLWNALQKGFTTVDEAAKHLE